MTLPLMLVLIPTLVTAADFDSMIQGDSGAYYCRDPEELFADRQCTQIDDEQICLPQFLQRCRKAFADQGRELPRPRPSKDAPPDYVNRLRAAVKSVDRMTKTESLGVASDKDRDRSRAIIATQRDGAPPVEPPAKSQIPEYTSGVDKDQAPKMLSEAQALKMYGDFSGEQMPPKARFTFEDWSIPAGTNCANTRRKTMQGREVQCTPCAAAAAKDSRTLGGYILDHVNVGRNLVYQKSTYTLYLEGARGAVTLTCAPYAAFETTPDALAILKAFGITAQFPVPREAKLIPPRDDHPTTAF